MEARTLGLVLNEARVKLGLKLREVAEKVGVSAMFISQLENNKRNVNENLLEKITEVLDLDYPEALSLLSNKKRRPIEGSNDYRLVLTRRIMDTPGIDSDKFQEILKLLK